MQNPKCMLYSSGMANDHLSEMLDLIEVRGVVSGGVVVDRPWRARASVVEDLKFCALIRGEAWLSADGVDEPLHLAEGEVVILNGRSWLSLCGPAGEGTVTDVAQPADGTISRLGEGRPEDADVFIGGRLDLDEAGRELLLTALPPVAHVHSGMPSAARIRGHLDHLFDEITAERPGSRFAVREYSQLFILEVVRAFASSPSVPTGWLRLLGDERLRPALTLIHEQPEVAWRVDDLARAAAMSRTSFAVHFREVAGIPPLAYLVQWRMMLAKRELRSAESRMRGLAVRLGYSSESSFSSAFKRSVGESPHSYRRRVRAG